MRSSRPRPGPTVATAPRTPAWAPPGKRSGKATAGIRLPLRDAANMMPGRLRRLSSTPGKPAMAGGYGFRSGRKPAAESQRGSGIGIGRDSVRMGLGRRERRPPSQGAESPLDATYNLPSPADTEPPAARREEGGEGEEVDTLPDILSPASGVIPRGGTQERSVSLPSPLSAPPAVPEDPVTSLTPECPNMASELPGHGEPRPPDPPGPEMPSSDVSVIIDEPVPSDCSMASSLSESWWGDVWLPCACAPGLDEGLKPSASYPRSASAKAGGHGRFGIGNITVDLDTELFGRSFSCHDDHIQPSDGTLDKTFDMSPEALGDPGKMQLIRVNKGEELAANATQGGGASGDAIGLIPPPPPPPPPPAEHLMACNQTQILPSDDTNRTFDVGDDQNKSTAPCLCPLDLIQLNTTVTVTELEVASPREGNGGKHSAVLRACELPAGQEGSECDAVSPGDCADKLLKPRGQVDRPGGDLTEATPGSRGDGNAGSIVAEDSSSCESPSTDALMPVSDVIPSHDPIDRTFEVVREGDGSGRDLDKTGILSAGVNEGVSLRDAMETAAHGSEERDGLEASERQVTAIGVVSQCESPPKGRVWLRAAGRQTLSNAASGDHRYEERPPDGGTEAVDTSPGPSGRSDPLSLTLDLTRDMLSESPGEGLALVWVAGEARACGGGHSGCSEPSSGLNDRRREEPNRPAMMGTGRGRADGSALASDWIPWSVSTPLPGVGSERAPRTSPLSPVALRRGPCRPTGAGDAERETGAPAKPGGRRRGAEAEAQAGLSTVPAASGAGRKSFVPTPGVPPPPGARRGTGKIPAVRPRDPAVGERVSLSLLSGRRASAVLGRRREAANAGAAGTRRLSTSSEVLPPGVRPQAPVSSQTHSGIPRINVPVLQRLKSSEPPAPSQGKPTGSSHVGLRVPGALGHRPRLLSQPSPSLELKRPGSALEPWRRPATPPKRSKLAGEVKTVDSKPVSVLASGQTGVTQRVCVPEVSSQPNADQNKNLEKLKPKELVPVMAGHIRGLEENAALSEENTALREENAALREENTALRQRAAQCCSHQETIAALETRVTALEREMAAP